MPPHAWNGPASYLFIPLVVTETAGYDAPPPNYREFIQRRVWFDPDPQTNEDRSLMSYISSISYGRANLDATVARPVTLNNLAAGMNPTLLAINAQPDAHNYEYLAVVYPPNRRGAGGGMAQPGQIQFNPPRVPNRTKARSRFRHDDPLGTWAMEVLHNVTDIGDYYNNASNPDDFDEMAGIGATHPCSYTKVIAGWLGWGDIAVHPNNDSPKSYALHAIGLSNPIRPGHVAGVKVQAPGSNRYLIVEARLRSDRWDRGFSGSTGIPSEGVVVYEFSPETDSWPKLNDPGPWPPLELRTPTALTVGQTFTHHDSSTPGDAIDNRTGIGRHRTVTVKSDSVAGFVAEITSDDRRGVPDRPVPDRPSPGNRPPGSSEP